MNSENSSVPRKNLYLALIFLVALACLLYLPKVNDSIGWYNSGEFVAASLTLDVPHAPGYPLLTRLGNLFLQIPVSLGSAMKLNLLSSFIGILTVCLMMIFLYLAEISIFPAVSACIFLLSSRTYFDQSVSIEVYCMEVGLIILGLIVGIFIARGSNSPVTSFSAGLIGTLGVGHRPTYILFAITLIFFINARKNELKGLSFFWFVAGMSLGAVPSLDLFFRLQSPDRVLLDPLVGQGFSGFLRVYSGTVYGGGLFSMGLAEVFSRLLYFFKFILEDSPFILIPGTFIALLKTPEDSPVKKALVCIGTVNLFFVLNYNAFEAHTMLLPCIFSLCAMTSFALNMIRIPKIRNLVCFLLSLTALAGAFPNQIPLSDEPVNYCERALRYVPLNSVLMMSNDVEFRPFYYLRVSKMFRPDIAIQLVDKIESSDLAGLGNLKRQKNVEGTFVYPTNAIQELVASFSMVCQGYGFRIVEPDFPLREFRSNAEDKVARFGNSEIRFPEYVLANPELKPGNSFPYEYHFSGSSEDFCKLKVWAYLTDSENRKITRNGLLVGHDCHFPADYVYRGITGSNESVQLKITRALVLPFDILPGKYKLKLFFEKRGIAKIQDELPKVENVNLFNFEGFLEVFKLNYGLSNRLIIEKDKVAEFNDSSGKFFTIPGGPDVSGFEIKPN